MVPRDTCVLSPRRAVTPQTARTLRRPTFIYRSVSRTWEFDTHLGDKKRISMENRIGMCFLGNSIWHDHQHCWWFKSRGTSSYGNSGFYWRDKMHLPETHTNIPSSNISNTVIFPWHSRLLCFSLWSVILRSFHLLNRETTQSSLLPLDLPSHPSSDQFYCYIHFLNSHLHHQLTSVVCNWSNLFFWLPLVVLILRVFILLAWNNLSRFAFGAIPAFPCRKIYTALPSTYRL